MILKPMSLLYLLCIIMMVFNLSGCMMNPVSNSTHLTNEDIKTLKNKIINNNDYRVTYKVSSVEDSKRISFPIAYEKNNNMSYLIKESPDAREIEQIYYLDSINISCLKDGCHNARYFPDTFTVITDVSYIDDLGILDFKKERLNGREVYCILKEEMLPFLEEIHKGKICFNNQGFIQKVNLDIYSKNLKSGLFDNNYSSRELEFNLYKVEDHLDKIETEDFYIDNLNCAKKKTSFSLYSLGNLNYSLTVTKIDSLNSSIKKTKKIEPKPFKKQNLEFNFNNSIMDINTFELCLGEKCVKESCYVERMCKDVDTPMDNGVEFTRGYASDNKSKIEDSCKDENILIEAVCDQEEDTPATVEIDCDCGCMEGVCGNIPELHFSLSKNIAKPDEDGDHIVQWVVLPELKLKNLDTKVLVKEVRVWVTETMNPNNETGIEHIYNLNKIISNDENFEVAPWYFNYTDGSGIDFLPPVVWIEPKWCGVDE